MTRSEQMEQSERMERIVVGVDHSAGAQLAFDRALAETRVHRASLTVVHAWEYPYVAALSVTPTTVIEAVEDAAHELLDEIVARADASDVEVKCVLVNGSAPSAPVDTAAGADLLVVGSRGRGGLAAVLLGSVAMACLHRARCPVAIVHRGAGDHGVVAVGVDGSDNGWSALRWAAREAARRHARLQVVRAWGYLEHLETTRGTVDPEWGEERVREMTEQGVRDVLGRDHRAEVAVVNDVATSALEAVALDADVLVVGSRGLGGFKGLLLGSVSQHVAAHADCSVVVVPH